MIVPRAKLLFWVSVVVLPFALLAGVEPAASYVSLVAFGSFLTLALVDAVRARASLTGISVVLPEVARMSKDRAATLEVRVGNARQKRKIIRLGLPLPREFDSQQEEAVVDLPGGVEWSRFNWACLPRKRGNYSLDAVYLEASSPFGFWAVRKQAAVRSQIRVYPNLFAERRDLAALFLHRGLFGLHAQRQVGKGREFEKLREYIPGDGYDEIHWKATAKRGRPVTKIFQIERTQEVYVVIDASRLSARTVASSNLQTAGHSEFDESELEPGACRPAPATALERFVTVGLVLGMAAEQQGDLFGLLTFTDKVESFVRARNGKAHYSSCRDALYTLHPRIVTPDYNEVCSFIRLRLRHRALIVILTSLDDPVLAESFVRNMDLIRRQHLVLVNMLQPAGASPLFTNPKVTFPHELYHELGGHLIWHNLRELAKTLQRRGVGFSLLKNDRLSAELVSQYLAVKQRQTL